MRSPFLSLISLSIAASALCATVAASAQNSGRPGPEAAAAKLATAELNKDILDFTARVSGPAGLHAPKHGGSLPEPRQELPLVENERNLVKRSHVLSTAE